jgi:hypothetical protein
VFHLTLEFVVPGEISAVTGPGSITNGAAVCTNCESRRVPACSANDPYILTGVVASYGLVAVSAVSHEYTVFIPDTVLVSCSEDDSRLLLWNTYKVPQN